MGTTCRTACWTGAATVNATAKAVRAHLGVRQQQRVDALRQWQRLRALPAGAEQEAVAQRAQAGARVARHARAVHLTHVKTCNRV